MKKITLDDLAKELKISKGTVDRAIHNRPGVSPKTKAKVLDLVKKYNYRPDKVARVMSLKAKKITIGVVCPAEPAFFWQHVISGLKAAQKEFADFGLEVKCKTTGAPRETIIIVEKIQQLAAERCEGLVVVPTDTPQLKEKIAELKGQGIPVVTLNDDLEDSQRLFYVGPQLRQSGRAAGELLGRFLRGRGRVAAITGSVQSYEYRERLCGFCEVLAERYQGIEVVGQYTIDYNQKDDMLEAIRNLDGIYNCDGASLAEVGELIASTETILVGHEISEKVEELLQAGIVDAVISQDPFAQGYYAIKFLFDYLAWEAAPPCQQMYTRLDVILRENLNLGEQIINPYYT
ncbi:MAG: substrate-binding domain-containing protein [Firmicutes bacterium]|jgi:LacI family transcriptional regulator|nr:substrate-binding domain-containing protein [Bacillota bacterium]HOB23016.1 LacI family DNA-binding transcriptional regulator [Bacillota bacterium]HQD40398.1 LacI family DNA-binding transcriptional regulator [Bacillota bacterium]